MGPIAARDSRAAAQPPAAASRSSSRRRPPASARPRSRCPSPRPRSAEAPGRRAIVPTRRRSRPVGDDDLQVADPCRALRDRQRRARGPVGCTGSPRCRRPRRRTPRRPGRGDEDTLRSGATTAADAGRRHDERREDGRTATRRRRAIAAPNGPRAPEVRRTVPSMPPATSDLAAALAPDLLDRFVRYARIDTQAGRERTQSPSTPGQLELGAHRSSRSSREIGLQDAAQDDNGYVDRDAAGQRRRRAGHRTHRRISTRARTRRAPGVEPIVHRGLRRRRDRAARERHGARPGRAAASWRGRAGHDIVTSSGDTLLGADDKAGVAEIVTAVAHLAAHPELPRPTLRVGFTPDEEIGEGASLFDIEALRRRAAPTRSTARASASCRTRRSPPPRSRSASRASTSIPASPPASSSTPGALAARILTALPSDRLTPETTSGREGFIHLYETTATPRSRDDGVHRPRLRRRSARRARGAAAPHRGGGHGDASRGATHGVRRTPRSTRTCARTSTRSRRS